MTTEAILFGVSCGLAYLLAVTWRQLRRVSKAAEELIAELQRAGWTKEGKEQ